MIDSLIAMEERFRDMKSTAKLGDDILPALEQAKTVTEPPPLWDGRAAERVGDILAAQAHSSVTEGVYRG